MTENQKEQTQEMPGFIQTGKKIIETLTTIYLAAILFVFPLYFRNYYFDILIVKYQFFYVSTLLLIGLSLITALIMLIKDLSSCQGRYSREFFGRFSPENIRKTLHLPDWFMALFLLISVISTLLSDYKYEAFWGNEGRYTGLFLLLLYGFSFYIVSRFFRFKSWILDVFLVSSLLVCLFGITDYFDMDLLGFKANIAEDQRYMFTSFLGNINTYTAYLSLVLGVSAVLFGGSDRIGKTVWYYICLVTAMFAIVTGQSDNAYLALLALFGFLPFYLFGTGRGIRRYVLLLASFFTVIEWIRLIELSGLETIEIDGVFRVLADFRGLEIIVAALWAAAALLYSKKGIFGRIPEDLGYLPRRIWGCAVAAGVIVVLGVLIDANLLGHGERYGALQGYVLFNDEWGTHRGYIWRIAMENYSQFSWIHKLFGYGPDTFGIITINNNYNDMVIRYHEIFDSVHNEYLQYFITIGPVGLAAYLGLLISSCFYMIRRGKENLALTAAAFAVICYGAQAFVNINLPIATPVMWTILMAGLAGAFQEDKKSLER